MLLSLLLSVCIIIFIFFLALSFKCFFFPFSVLESLARWAVSSFSSSSTSSSPPSPSLLVWRRTRPPIGDHRQKEKKNKSCCQPEPTISAIYLTMATVDGKDLPHDPLPHGRQGMSSLFFSPFLLLSNRSWHCVVLLLLSLPAGNGFVMRR